MCVCTYEEGGHVTSVHCLRRKMAQILGAKTAEVMFLSQFKESQSRAPVTESSLNHFLADVGRIVESNAIKLAGHTHM